MNLIENIHSIEHSLQFFTDLIDSDDIWYMTKNATEEDIDVIALFLRMAKETVEARRENRR